MLSNSVVQTGGQEGGREGIVRIHQHMWTKRVNIYGASEDVDEDRL